MNENGKMNRGSVRRLRMGGYSIILVIAVIAAAVVVNLIVGELPIKYTMIDLTGSGIYELSDKTVEFLDALSEDITIYVITTDVDRDYKISSFLDMYADASDHIKVVEVNPDENPAFVDDHGVATMNSLVVESAKRTETIDYYDIYEFSDELWADYYSDYNNLIYGKEIYDVYSPDIFDADNEVTSAIDYVTTDNLPVAYALTGHGEIAFPSAVAGLIDSSNVTMGDLNMLTTGSVPDDASVVIINNPSIDLSGAELQALISFVDGGGKVVLVTDITSFSVDGMPNLTSLAAHCGLKAYDGVVLEGDGQRYDSQDPFTLVEPLGSSIITADIENPSRYSLVLRRAHAIVEDEAYEGSMTRGPIIGTSTSAYIIGDNEAYRERGDDDLTGEFWIGAISSDESTGAMFLWYSTSTISSEQYVIYNNSIIFAASVTLICDKPMTISIDAVKTGSGGALIFTETNGNILTVLIQYVIPAAVLIFGFVVWLRRRLR